MGNTENTMVHSREFVDVNTGVKATSYSFPGALIKIKDKCAKQGLKEPSYSDIDLAESWYNQLPQLWGGVPTLN